MLARCDPRPYASSGVSCLLLRATPLSLVMQDQLLGPSASRVKRSRMVFISRYPLILVWLCGRVFVPHGGPDRTTTTDSLWSPQRGLTPDTTRRYESIVPTAWRGLSPSASSLGAINTVILEIALTSAP
jgi:hypothetical protein